MSFTSQSRPMLKPDYHTYQNWLLPQHYDQRIVGLIRQKSLTNRLSTPKLQRVRERAQSVVGHSVSVTESQLLTKPTTESILSQRLDQSGINTVDIKEPYKEDAYRLNDSVLQKLKTAKSRTIRAQMSNFMQTANNMISRKNRMIQQSRVNEKEGDTSGKNIAGQAQLEEKGRDEVNRSEIIDQSTKESEMVNSLKQMARQRLQISHRFAKNPTVL